MNWEKLAEGEFPVPKQFIENIDVRLSVSDYSDLRWQQIIISFGVNSDREAEECRCSWPREAIALARAKLDEFEKLCDSGINSQ